jgi:N-acetylglutamate synthase-like GNAT family acetyltransferase
MEIRLAKDTDGVRIARLLHADEAEYDKVFPYWVIAEKDGNIVAALQMSPSLPVGKVEQLVITEEAGDALHALIDYAIAYLKHVGCKKIMAYVPFKQKKVKRMYQKEFKAAVTNSGSALVWRI